ncbi:MAG: tetratricopeptide repeat protein [Chloroflexi bacterium]|nr:tetratricopeptide repeat protein [Chloroflexota bacterium]
MTQSTTETITFFLEKILNDVHPLMAEGIYLAAVPHWYDAGLFAAIRNRDDGRNQGLIERLTRYSFIMRWEDEDDGRQIYAVRAEERMLIQRYWITKDPEAYRETHRRALAYWEANPDPNPFAHAQNRLYHQLFVDQAAAADYLVDRFRAYHNERQLAAIERLLDTADKARFYLSLLDGQPQGNIDDLLIHLRARLAQLRDDWAESREQLQTLRLKENLSPSLQPYVTRAYGYALAHTGDYVGAIAEYEAALTTFKEREEARNDDAAFTTTLEAEQAHTMIALGDAHVGLAASVHSAERSQPILNFGILEKFGFALRPFRHLLTFVLSLPLIVYLGLYLGRRVWHPRFWPALVDLDWIIARLYAAGARYYRRADPILERCGEPSEGVAADEKLAYLYLAMGDADGAQSQFERLLQEKEAPLGEYRQAAVRVGLGQSWLQQEQPAAAREQLEQALPALRQYEDAVSEATARATLAESLYAAGEKEEAVNQFSRAAQLREAQEAWTAATDIVERMEALIAADDAARLESSPSGLRNDRSPQISEMATAVSRKLSRRQYTTHFRHPLLIQFRRFTLLLLPLVALLMPLLVIRLDTGSALTPAIQFKAAPIFNPAQTVSSQLSQGVTTANVVAAADSDLIVWLAVVLLAGYVLLSLALGLLLIVLTPLRTVQAKGRAATVILDDDGIRVGERGAKWVEIAQFVKGDARLWRRPLPDESAFALVTPQERLIVHGSANWYASLRRRAETKLPDSAQIIDRDYAILESKPGRIYLINVVVITVMAALAWLAPAPLWLTIPGLPYSLADLYPYFYLGLIGLPTWWLVARPLQTRLQLKPNSGFPWWVLGAGLGLALFQAVTLFRPLLTSVNLYPPLVTLIMMAGGAAAVWRAQDRGQPVYSTPIRGGTAVLTVAVGLLMALLLWREVGAYHYLVLGNARRDRAPMAAEASEKEALTSGAINAYTQAIKIGSARILGIDVRTAARIPWGIPEPHSFTWLAALTNRAALQVQLGRYREAMGSYDVILDYTDRPADVYAWRAIAQQSWSATDTGEEVEIVANQYKLALDDFDRAIELKPRRAEFYLWRGVAYHALNDLELAWDNYEAALNLIDIKDAPLTDKQRERALTGQGWIKYHQEDFVAAQQLFKLATEANPDEAEAWVGLGYAAFSLQVYSTASLAWGQAFVLDPDDPAVLVSLGTQHWKLGGFAETEAGKCDEYGQSADFFAQAAELPGQEPEAAAFIYRTQAQLQYLLRDCPDRSFVEEMSAAIASYEMALTLDPDNTAYWQLKGRLGYALGVNDAVPAADKTAVFYEALAAINEAYRRDPNDPVTINFRNLILDALKPLAPADAADKMVAGAYETALEEAALLAEARPDNPAYTLWAGLTALATGDETQAQTWYDTGIVATETAENGVELLTQALADLDTLLPSQPNPAAAAVQSQLEAALVDLEAQDPATLFAEGLTALQAGQTGAAAALYQDGLTAAVRKGHLAATATAVFDLLSLPAAQTRRIEPLFAAAFPQLAQIGEADEMVETAVNLALIATILEEFDEAAVWYNEAARRTFEDNSQYNQLRQSRNKLRTLWTITGVNSDDILQAVQAQLPQQLRTHPQLADEGYYWRYRAWFKYGLGLSAFRLGAETAAAAAFQSAQEDANRAYALDPDRQSYAKTYLEEGAWGWFHIERGNDAYAEGDYKTALADYEAAADLIQPVANGDARKEATLAAFSAGLASVQLKDFEQAADWYAEGMERAALYAVPDQIAPARDALLSLQSERPNLADDIDALLELFPG